MNTKGLIVTIILIVAPILWLVVSLNSVNNRIIEAPSGDAEEIENSINEITSQFESNNQSTFNKSSELSGDVLGSKYGTPISKLIENAKVGVESAKVYAEPDETQLPNGTLYKDMLVTVQDYANGWSQVRSENLTGWTLTDNIIKPDEVAENASLLDSNSAIGKSATIIVANVLNVRDSADGKQIGTIAGGTDVKIIGANVGETWYQIQWGSNVGWISASEEYVRIKE